MSITDELREWWVRKFPIMDKELHEDFTAIADRIDAEHAQLERDYKVACEVNERQDEQYVDMVHKLDRAYEKNRNQRKQLTEVQEALHRRNEGELKRRWMREKQDLELQIAKMHLESVELPEDADGVPIHAGDTLDGYGKTIEVVEMRYGRGGWVLISRDGNGYADTFAFTHHHAPTVEERLSDEEVVRCSDCACFSVDDSDHDYRTGWWCKRWHTDMVKPDGFCAWGKRNEDDSDDAD